MSSSDSKASLTKELSYGHRTSILFIVEAAVYVESYFPFKSLGEGIGTYELWDYVNSLGSSADSSRQYRAIRRARTPGRIVEDDACDSSLFLSLMLGEALRAIGKLMSIEWILKGAIIADTPLCPGQGVVQLLATNIIDWSTLAISIQTTVILITPWRTPKHFAKYLVLAVWVIVSVIVGSTLGVEGLEMFEPANFWCWHRPDLNLVLLLSEYLWMWIILFLMMILYVIDALIIRGSVENDGWRIRWVSRSRSSRNVREIETQEELVQREAQAEEELERKQAALQLFLYPVVYFITVSPFTITEWLSRYSLPGRTVFVPHQAAALTSSIFTLSGLFNVILYFKTRPGLFKGNDAIQPGLGGDVLPPSTPHADGSEKPIGEHGGYAQRLTSQNLSARLGAVERRPAAYLEAIDYSRGKRQFPNTSKRNSSTYPAASERATDNGEASDGDDVGHLPP
ncbi:hypothetical protein NMY22_g8439 [Coprinellus aureogranulatus]|nr:hypothetical protein NMY22_g8439 [Coprinellus aureogranulatus]